MLKLTLIFSKWASGRFGIVSIGEVVAMYASDPEIHGREAAWTGRKLTEFRSGYQYCVESLEIVVGNSSCYIKLHILCLL